MRYLIDNLPYVLSLAGQHLLMSGVSLAIALAIALPMGIICARVAWLRSLVLGILGIIYTIPSLSLFVLLIPFTGLGLRPAVIALVAYAQLVLVRNVVVGLTGIDPAIVEAARGMGMTALQRLWRVELPLALPIILAGVRVATLSIIAIGTIAAFINAGGLGLLLFDGVRSSNPEKIIAGAVAVSVLAIGANGVLWAVEQRATQAMQGGRGYKN
ncbi:ABC transporter permease [Roseiflexus castenholzii]|uniref:Binding-protein-dependent transport systems inner membrane component n=1 Tax=Roseiflexus castenholzii (strain DSM 13941 / HLO8) TaxID=383372 RepID=A7NM56_ROSCS|nr:ABC transporter permease [Roseiflexus castenholzii]ABU58611.1 binding-protein-dependent transport systems inner membrane component [Roseiflexus castenholzii DSM 13941]